ncbi:hypothetical protein C8Q72DRAFT_877690 [Fomitopsis betulina]|nr:hypothetical protein C8Q72DRAFT_877690 [Fomitopsis betulina]
MSPPGQTASFTVAFITGAAQGIGKDIALRLADEGFNVAINDIPSNAANLDSVAKEVAAKGRTALPLLGDVSQEDAVRTMVEKTVAVLGRLDVVLDTEAFDRSLAVNVRGVMLCYKYAARQMIKQGNGGRILGGPAAASYVASKFAVRGLTQCLALELAPHHITVNAYSPGVILTPMSAVCGLPPDGPSASPEVVSSLVSYLVKPEAYFITGQAITMDGGVVFS